MKTLLSLIIFQLGFSQTFQELTEAKLRELLPQAELSFRKVAIPKQLKTKIEKTARQRFFRPSLYTWKVTLADSSEYFAVLDNVIGKVQPITFLTVFSSDLKVQFVEVMKYREAYGGEVRRQSFLVQFKEKDNRSSFAKGEEIKNISGATISVNSLSRGVKKLTRLSGYIKGVYAKL